MDFHICQKIKHVHDIIVHQKISIFPIFCHSFSFCLQNLNIISSSSKKILHIYKKPSSSVKQKKLHFPQNSFLRNINQISCFTKLKIIQKVQICSLRSNCSKSSKGAKGARGASYFSLFSLSFFIFIVHSRESVFTCKVFLFSLLFRSRESVFPIQRSSVIF